MLIDPSGLDAKALYRLMISVIVPRPIAWVSTRSPGGVLNAAPFSYFQALSSSPPSLMISVGRRRDGRPKDTLAHLRATGEFVVNVVSESSAERMVKTSLGYETEVSEFAEVGLEPVPGLRVAAPRIAESAVSMECRLDRIIEIGKSSICIGEIVAFHIRDDVLASDGATVDPLKLNPLGRMGGEGYAPLREVVRVTPDEGASSLSAELVDLWAGQRDRTIAMARVMRPEHLARSGAGMSVGGMLRHLAACTALRVLEWSGCAGEYERPGWEESWTVERITAELEADKRAFVQAALERLANPKVREQVGRMIRHEGWHQGQIAAILRDDFAEDRLWTA